MNFGTYPKGNGLSRLASRNLDNPANVDDLQKRIGDDLDAQAADEAGLVTFTPDDIDWEDEVRIAPRRSEEHTSELQSLMRISYAVFRLKKKQSSQAKLLLHMNNTTLTAYR